MYMYIHPAPFLAMSHSLVDEAAGHGEPRPLPLLACALFCAVRGYAVQEKE